MLFTALVFLIILSLLVFVHEAGHFFVAKWFKIKVEEFGFGLPPRAWGKKIGETIYSINWLPIGGFVKLYGEDDAGSGRIRVTNNKQQLTINKKDEKRAFYSRPVWQRALVVVAGVVMNTILAVVLFYIFLFISNFKTELPLFGPHQFIGVNQTTKTEIIINGISKNSPAEKAKLTPGVKVLSVNGEKITSVQQFSEAIKKYKGKPVTLEWIDLRTSQAMKATMIPRVNPPKNEGALGVSFLPLEFAVLAYDTPGQRLLSGFTHPTNLMIYNFKVLGQLVKVSVREKTAAPISEGVAGPVGIFSLVGTIVQIPDVKERMLQILNLAGMLSISLAFFNVLPIPALDGGRLFFILIEGITRRKVNARFEAIAHTVGMALLLLLIAVITFKDIFQFILNPR